MTILHRRSAAPASVTVPREIAARDRSRCCGAVVDTNTATGYSLFIVICCAVLIYGFASAAALGAASSTRSAWVGEYVQLISPEEEVHLGGALRAFFGKEKGNVVSSALIPGVGSLLFDQFAAVDYGFRMWQYRLPSGRLIWQRSDGRSGVDAVVVPKGSGSVPIAAAALLTHLCPKGGVNESFRSGGGRTFEMHARCESHYSLVIFYPRGTTPDPDLNADLMKWAKASIEARLPPIVQPVRVPGLKVFVRVL